MDRTKIKFSVLQISYWCAYGSFYSFMAAYMQSRGMSATLLGIMLTMNTLGGFGGQFFWGMLCDLFKTNKKIYVLECILVGLLEVLIFTSANWILIIVGVGLLGFVQLPMIVNLDTWILKTFNNSRVYGPIRSTASIAFAIFTFFFGKMLSEKGYSLMLVYSTAFLLLGIVTALFTPEETKEDPQITRKTEKKCDWKILFHNREFLLVLCLLLGIGISAAPVMQLMAVLMDNVGGSVEYVGYALFASSMIQVPFMCFSGKLSRFSAKGRLLCVGILYMLSVLGMSYTTSPLVLLAFCALNGIGYGIFLPALRQMVFDITPRELNTTAQGICEATYNSLGSMISSLLAGILIDQYSVSIMLLACVAIQAVLMVSYLVGRNYVRIIH